MMLVGRVGAGGVGTVYLGVADDNAAAGQVARGVGGACWKPDGETVGDMAPVGDTVGSMVPWVWSQSIWPSAASTV